MRDKIAKGSYQEKLYSDPSNLFLFANRSQWKLLDKLNKLTKLKATRPVVPKLKLPVNKID